MKLRWCWQALLGIALAGAAVGMFDGSGDGPAVSADQPAVTIAPEPYIVVKAKKSFVGWHRVTLEIEADSATTPGQQIETMMQAAVDQFPKHNADVVSVRLWDDYGSDGNVRYRLVYAPDGCGWAGQDGQLAISRYGSIRFGARFGSICLIGTVDGHVRNAPVRRSVAVRSWRASASW